ncbi:hypothetical protein D1871_03840 [Nakamurella silvestris]|nr:hypothetical protein D1871_03840 [Nakamurella silvestris]
MQHDVTPAPRSTDLRPWTAPSAAELDSPNARSEHRRTTAVRRTRFRSRPWYPLYLLLVFLTSVWLFLRGDQWLADKLIWPANGAEFVPVSQKTTQARPDHRYLTVVIGGLNRKSGSYIAQALRPSLSRADTDIYSLVYGTSIVDVDLTAKFIDLLESTHPDVVNFYGSSMGGDVALNLASQLGRMQGQPMGDEGYLFPSVGTIFLDCTPLSTADVRQSSRTKADLLSAITEAIGTEGGAISRVAVEMLAQRHQWASGVFPFPGGSFRFDDFKYKLSEIVRDKISGTGISTQLVTDQYGVIRRFRADDVLSELPPGARLVYFRPEIGTDDNTINVARVQQQLEDAAATYDLDLTVFLITDGEHASAEKNATQYNQSIRVVYGLEP